jgi:hypothetical protein
VIAYLLKRGITQEQIDAIRRILLDTAAGGAAASSTPSGGAGK